MAYLNQDHGNSPAFYIGNVILNSNKSFLTHYKKNQRINFDDNNVFYLSKGNIEGYSFDESILLYNMGAPEIIGVEKMNDFSAIKYLRCVTDVDIHIIHQSHFRCLLDNFNLWPSAFEILSTYYSVCHRRMNRINRPTRRDIIIQFIKYIWINPNIKRDTTSIYTYIQVRTQISRSFIHKTVSELAKDGFINMDRGVLISCNFS